MSYQYDQYLAKHKENVKKGYDWLSENLPDLIKDISNLEWQCCFAHDQSKSEQDEYEAYDAYFYGNNKSYAVVQEYRRAWLLHLHRNPHHWQHWILINDDPEEGEIVLEMPVNYILEMICDWWAFSWAKGNLFEVFKWYDEHKDHMKLAPNTRKQVENILRQIKEKLDGGGDELTHHGIKGQKWGVKNGPPYPLKNTGAVEKTDKPGIIKVTISGHESSPKQSSPNAVIDHVTDDGKIDKRSYYDERGRKVKDIHTTDHGHPKQHNIVPHAHDYGWNEDMSSSNKSTRELTDLERKENDDIL